MQLNDFDFSLPEELIAQQPAPQRDASRLMCLDRRRDAIAIRDFRDIVEYFQAGDLLVVNDTRVIPARLPGHKETGGRVEVLLVRRCVSAEAEEWLCLTGSNKPLRPGTLLHFAGGVSAEVLADAEAPYRRLRFACQGPFLDRVEEIGQLPLPPYIRRSDTAEDRRRYQTVFAQNSGAVAAPTAGLHFTEEILQQLRDKGVQIRPLTLHVGLGTFLPVRVEDIREHRMHSEFYSVPEETAAAVNAAKQERRRVFALGTTSCRALETAADAQGCLRAGAGESDIFIYPGHDFKLVDALVTNFHLPKSTLLMLVSAFAGREFTLAAYRRAVEARMRFFSYGDCMLIV